jgi:hypothetical protein
MCLRAKSIAELMDTLIAFLYSLSHRSRSLSYDSRQLTSSAGLRDVAVCDGCVVRLQSKPHVTGRDGHVIDIATEEDSGYLSTLCQVSPHATARGYWLPGMTPQTSGHVGRMRWFSLGMKGGLGQWIFRGGYRPKQCRRPWPNLGTLHLWAVSRQSSWSLLQRGGEL